MELIERIREGPLSDTWRVRPLFVEGEEFDRDFAPGDRLTPLHSKSS